MSRVDNIRSQMAPRLVFYISIKEKLLSHQILLYVEFTRAENHKIL